MTARTNAATPLLEVEGLSIGAPRALGAAALVRDLSFAVHAGEVLGVVGESGSGKSLTAYAIAGVLPQGLCITAGRIALEGRELVGMHAPERRALAGSRIGMVFQDPLSSFNPVRTVGSILIESAMRHQRLSAQEARSAAIDALVDARLPDFIIDAYPHQLSGGQRQRAMIALARLNRPVLLIADEPTTALDATVQLQILALLKRSVGTGAMALITHDMGVAVTMCERILVMYRGECVEQGPTERILAAPRHPYTRRLLAAAQLQARVEGGSPWRLAATTP